jgi:L-alanine-DL-glutamate epimerase-like enolase superfamily enzyme
MHERAVSAAAFGPRGQRVPLGVLRVMTDEGIEGNSFLSSPGPGPAAIAEQIVTVVKPWLAGADPLDIGAHWRRMSGLVHYLSPHAVGSVDIALWDIAGKAAGLPVHRLLGTCRDRIPAYFSSVHHATAQEYADEAVYWREQGWRGYKLHPPRAPWLPPGGAPPVSFDVEACQAVRSAVGDGMTLMLDSSWSYSYPDALRVGRAIQDMDYFWYEDPLPDHDIHGYARLARHLRIPLLATEITPGGLAALPPWITAGATDFLRGDVVIKGGITGLMKIAHLAEAFGMNCEVHDSYNALNNVAGLHVMMAIDNCDWFEVLAFTRSGEHSLDQLGYGLAEPFRVDAQGNVHAPTSPGLGAEIDWPLINSSVSAVVTLPSAPWGACAVARVRLPGLLMRGSGYRVDFSNV